jgi:hypothetical protein
MPQTLAEKLAEVGKSIPNLLKEGNNGEYLFLRAVDVFNAIRGRLFEKGIIIVPSAVLDVKREQPYRTISDDITDEVSIKMRYEITDGNESIMCEVAGVGQDHEGKALYMASTGAKKDLLKSIFLIAGYEDDAEAQIDVARIPDGLAEKLDEAEKKFGPDLREHPISQRDVRAWGAACHKTGYSEKAKKAYLEKAGVEKISDLKRRDFPLAIKWALGEDNEAPRVDS